MKTSRVRPIVYGEQVRLEVAEEQFSTIEPISVPIVPERQSKKRWYGTHQYFTRRAWNIVQAYIKNFAPIAESVVLDPFGGSGITAVEAAILGRKGIAFDINPFAVFYARCAGTYYPYPLDPNKSELMPKFLEVIEYYEKHYPSGRLSDSKLLEFAKSYGIPRKKLLDHRVNACTYEMHTPKQLHDLALLRSAILSRKYMSLVTRDLLLFTFSAAVSKCNRTFVSAKGRKASRGGARIFSSFALNLPPNPVEIDVFPEFQSKFKKLLQAKHEVFVELSKHQKFSLRLEYSPAQEISKKLKPESVDYIFTDPPYGKLIPYMDLSSFFCDWLNLKITPEIREKDIIENSSMHRTKEHYYAELSKAFEEMFKVLKYNRWMTLVYAHRDTEYWDAIISSAQSAGFEFINAVYEKPEVIWSLTKKKNKATTFSGELYLNFRKVRSTKDKMISLLKKDFQPIIRNTVELAIVHNDGCASIEDVYAELVPILARNGLTGRFRKEKIDIKDYLEKDFLYNERKNGYELPADRKLSSFIPIEERVVFYVRDFLIAQKNLGRPAEFDEIISSVLPNLINGQIPSRDSIKDVLKRIAVRDNSGNWMLSDDPEGQVELPLPVAIPLPKEEPKTTRHNGLIWKLLYIGSKASLTPFLGKREQQDKEIVGTGIPFVSALPGNIGKSHRGKVEQIDVIWLNRAGTSEYAFEIEESTTILSGLERFSKLMEVHPNVAASRGLVVVIPKRRLRKLKDVLTSSTYVGKPLYFENKIRVLFTDDVDEMYRECRDSYFKVSSLEKLLKKLADL